LALRKVLANIVIPYACYHLSGVIATGVPNRIFRAAVATVGHLAGLITPLSLSAVGCHDVAFPLLLVLGTFVLFGFPWFWLLREADRA
jgi:hypothetical protein